MLPSLSHRSAGGEDRMVKFRDARNCQNRQVAKDSIACGSSGRTPLLRRDVALYKPSECGRGRVSFRKPRGKLAVEPALWSLTPFLQKHLVEFVLQFRGSLVRGHVRNHKKPVHLTGRHLLAQNLRFMSGRVFQILPDTALRPEEGAGYCTETSVRAVGGFGRCSAVPVNS